MAYDRLEPFGHTAMTWQMAMVAATVANVNRDPKRRAKPWDPEDFLPAEWRTPQEEREALTDRITSAMMLVGGANVVVNPPGTPRRSARRRAASSPENGPG